MPDILIQNPTLGINALVAENVLEPGASAQYSKNVLYERGVMKTPDGFDKLDLTTTGLNSGEAVLELVQWRELTGNSHLMAITKSKIYEHDFNNATWTDKSNGTYNSNLDYPISTVVFSHNDTDIYLDDNSSRANAYQHLLVCDGGFSNIQRWAGTLEADFADLKGGEDYHLSATVTAHRARQVTSWRSRILLLGSLYYSDSAGEWIPNEQRVQWSAVGKAEDWTATNGGGFVDLVDTGGYNIWSAPLSNQFIIYQNNSIWGLNYVGGTTVFEPVILLPDTGLLAPHAIVQYKNVHYFMGNDYNIHAYYGGSVRKNLGDSIHKFLKDDVNTDFEFRCRLFVDPIHDKLWVFIIKDGYNYITKAYGMDLKNGAWMIRDYTNNYSTDSGITSVAMSGAAVYTLGETYKEALLRDSTYQSSDNTSDTAGDVTLKYGDVLCENTLGGLDPTETNRIDWSTLSAVAEYDFSWKAGEIDFSVGGLKMDFSYSNDPTKLICASHGEDGTTYSGAIIRIDDCSNSTNMNNGTHYYTLGSVCSKKDGATTDYSVTVYLLPSETTGVAVADTSNDTPVLVGDTTATLFDPSGATYRESIEQIQTDDQIVFGDSAGFVYQMDETYTTENSVDISAAHVTPVYDLGLIDTYKRWPGIAVTAKGTGVTLQYRTSYFDTESTGWTDITTLTLTNQYETYKRFVNTSSPKIQFKFKSEYDFEIRSFAIVEPLIEEDR